MPPKAKFSREEIIDAAINIVREDGFDALTSRALGKKLGSSARPIFTVFQNMEEVQPVSYTHLDVYKRQVLRRPAYDACVRRGSKESKCPRIWKNRGNG